MSEKSDNLVPSDDDDSNQNDHDNDCDTSDMPPLEDNDPNAEDLKNKKIIIEDKKELKMIDGDYIDILDNGDLLKKVITAGEKDNPRPERGCTVIIKIITKIHDTQTIVESETHDKLDIVVGDSDIVQGLDLAIPLMDQKEVANVIIKPRFGYGKLGKGNEIPPNCTLECQIHLLSVHWNDEETVYPIDERLRIGKRKKERGNFWYQRGDYSTAIQCYRSAINYLDARDEEIANSNAIKSTIDENIKGQSSDNDNSLNIDVRVNELIELRSATFNNLAAAEMKVDATDAALKSVDSALMLQPDNVKALFRKGKILVSKGDLDDAIELMRKALTIETDNKAIQKELSAIITKRKKELITERNLYKRMLELDKSNDKDSGNNKKNSFKWIKCGLIGGFIAAAAGIVAFKVAQ